MRQIVNEQLITSMNRSECYLATNIYNHAYITYIHTYLYLTRMSTLYIIYTHTQMQCVDCFGTFPSPDMAQVPASSAYKPKPTFLGASQAELGVRWCSQQHGWVSAVLFPTRCLTTSATLSTRTEVRRNGQWNAARLQQRRSSASGQLAVVYQ